MDDIVLTSFRSVLKQWDLPLKIDIYACQHNDVEGLALSQEGKPLTYSDKLHNVSTYLWLLSTVLPSTICDWSACWSVMDAQYLAVPGDQVIVPVVSVSVSEF